MNSESSRPHPMKSSLKPLTSSACFFQNAKLHVLIPDKRLLEKLKSFERRGDRIQFFRFSTPGSEKQRVTSFFCKTRLVELLLRSTLHP